MCYLLSVAIIPIEKPLFNGRFLSRYGVNPSLSFSSENFCQRCEEYIKPKWIIISAWAVLPCLSDQWLYRCVMPILLLQQVQLQFQTSNDCWRFLLYLNPVGTSLHDAKLSGELNEKEINIACKEFDAQLVNTMD